MTQDSQVLRGSQEAGVSQETLDPWDPQAHPSEIKVMEFHIIRRSLVSDTDMEHWALLAMWLCCGSILPVGVAAALLRGGPGQQRPPTRLECDTHGWLLRSGSQMDEAGMLSQPQATVEV